jgi:exonuclease III
MKIYSQNVFGLPGVGGMKARLNAICDEIIAEQPDLVILQEVHTYGALELIRSRLEPMRVAYESGRYGPRSGLAIFSRCPTAQLRFEPFSTRRRDVGRG